MPVGEEESEMKQDGVKERQRKTAEGIQQWKESDVETGEGKDKSGRQTQLKQQIGTGCEMAR